MEGSYFEVTVSVGMYKFNTINKLALTITYDSIQHVALRIIVMLKWERSTILIHVKVCASIRLYLIGKHAG